MGAIITAFILLVVFIGTTVFRPLKGEWVIYEENGDTINITIPNKQDLLVSFQEPELNATIIYHYDLVRPESPDKPYDASNAKKVEILVPIKSLDGSNENEKENYYIHSEDPEVIATSDDRVGEMYFYEVEVTLEIARTYENHVAFDLAVPMKSTKESTIKEFLS